MFKTKLMRTLIVLLVCHAALLLLAVTDFSLVSWLWGAHSWNVQFFELSFNLGGADYFESDYSLRQTLCYVAAYLLGLLTFAIAGHRYQLYPPQFAIIICFLGTLSFGLEATHWPIEHHLSLIVSFPILMPIFWLYLISRLHRISRRKVARQLIENPDEFPS